MFRARLAFCLFFLSLYLFVSSAFSYQEFQFVREIGEHGKPAGQRLVNGARALAVTPTRIFIADTDAHRILAYGRDGKLLHTWGTKGDKRGQFKYPGGIAVDEQSHVYVSDSGNGRIQVFDAEGKFLRSFGAKGSSPKHFSNPAGLTAFRGFLYIADTDNSRVQILTYDGIFTNQLVVKTKKDEMTEPVDVAVDLQNRIYVLDTDRNNIRVFDSSGALTGTFGSKGKGTDGLNGPQSLAVDHYGTVFISDPGNYKLKKFDSQGKLLASIGTEGDGPRQFRRIWGVDVDRDGKIYVLDAEKNTLQIFSCECGDILPLVPSSPLPGVELANEFPGAANALALEKRLWGVVGDSITALSVIAGRKISSVGSEPGLLKNARGLTVDPGGNFLVADTGNDRIQKFSREGTLLHVIGKSGSGEGEFRSPSGVAVSPKGNICVADTGNQRIQVFNSKGMFLGVFGKSGKLAGQFSAPVDLAVDSSENIYVVDRENNRIAKYDGSGTLVWETGKNGKQDGEFSAPQNILVTPDNEIMVLDSGNARIQVFDGSSGKFLRKFGSEGKGPGEFQSPVGLALEEGIRLFAGDQGNGRVQVFNLRHTPAIPKDVTAQASANEIQVSWKPNTETYLDTYKIYRSDSPAGEVKMIGASSEPFYIDRNLPSNQAFQYRISSQATGGNESAHANPVTAITPKLIPSSPKKIKIEPSEKQITLSWLPNTEPFLDHYRIYRSRQVSAGFELLKKSDKTVFVDSPLPDEALYYYQVTAVGKEGDESPVGEVVFSSTPKASLSLPPIEITKLVLSEVFASAYKSYESSPLGKIVIKNNTNKTFPKMKLSFSIKDFMDYPTEIDIPDVPAKSELTVELKPVFSNKILDVTENTSLQSEISLTYYTGGGEPKKVARSFPVTLYERHAMTWDQKDKIGAFVTPKDPAVADFSRLVIHPYVDSYPNLHSSIVYARTIYAALGVYGLSYIVDPSSPYQEFSGNTARVDYLQYPRDTLARKSGDCDDLSILFAACLENIGISTALVDVPGHVFIMFNTGVPEHEKETLGFSDSLVIPYRGTAWIPVELTLVGSSFTKAWQKGAEQFRDWSVKGKVSIIPIDAAWEKFKPATLPPGDVKTVKIKREEIEAKFKGELEALGQRRLANLSAEYLEALKKNPNDQNALSQLGILYGENGMYAESLVQFQKVLALDKSNAVALNNIGNINMLQERLEDARQAYESALKSSPDDTGIMVNLARVLSQTGKQEDARKLFGAAAEIDPRVLRKHKDLAVSLGFVK